MKKICNIILALSFCVCLTLSFTGCEGYVAYENSDRCGGIVKGYTYLGEKEESMTLPHEEHWTVMEIEITFDKELDIFYPFIFVSQSYFDYYNCATADELFQNEDFINTYSTATMLEVKSGKAILGINTAFQSNTKLFFYEGVNERNQIKIEDFSNYIGFINYN